MIECGQHWKVGVDARSTELRFLPQRAALLTQSKPIKVKPPARQRVIASRSLSWRVNDLILPYRRLGIVQAGCLLKRGEKVWVAPYDDTVLVMPSLRPCGRQHAGEPAVRRLGGMNEQTISGRQYCWRL